MKEPEIYFQPTWRIVDPICTFLFSILVIITTFAIIRDTINVLMEGLPKGVDFVQVSDTFLGIDGVLKVHNLRIWALSLDKIALSAHLAISTIHQAYFSLFFFFFKFKKIKLKNHSRTLSVPGINPQNVLATASKNIRSKYNFFEMTLQVEEFQEKMDNCLKCKMPEK